MQRNFADYQTWTRLDGGKMKTITRASRFQRLVYATVFRQVSAWDVVPARKAKPWAALLYTVCLLGVAAVFVLIYVAMP